MMSIAEAVTGAQNSGCTKAVEVALNAARMVDRQVTAEDVATEPVLMTGALEVLLFQVGNGRMQTPFMTSVRDFYYRTRRISDKQAAAVINTAVRLINEEQGAGIRSAVPVAAAPRPGPYGIYACTARGCREQGVPFSGSLPSQRRGLGFGGLRCNACGDCVVLTEVIYQSTEVGW